MRSDSGFSRILVLVLLIAAAAGLFLYFTKSDPSVPVQLVTAERNTVVSNLTTNGKAEPVDARELRALTSGLVTSVLVKEGDHARAGQHLLDLDRTETSADLARVEAELHAAEGDLRNVEHGGSAAESVELDGLLQKSRNERDEAARQLGISERLLAKNAAPRAEVDAAKERLHRADLDLAYLESRRTKRFSAADVDRAKARAAEAQASLKLAQQRLASTVVLSPVAGIIYSLPVQRGNYVNRGDLLAKVADTSKLRVKVYVDEPELGRIAAGQEALVTWDGAPSETWKGKVERMPAEVTLLGTRNVGQVQCTIENANGRLLPNINVNVEIASNHSERAITIAKEALVTEQGAAGKVNHYVFAYENGIVKRRAVTVGITTPTRVEILDGVAEGQQVAISPDHKLVDGMSVKSEIPGVRP
jgi:HlyD family secretion protein